MSLHYLVKCSSDTFYHWVVTEKKLQNLFHCNCGLHFRQIWIQLITACRKYCMGRCTKHASLIWSINEVMDKLGPNGCRNDDMIQLSHSVLSCCFSSSRSVMHIWKRTLAIVSHAVINWIQIWRIRGEGGAHHSWGGIHSAVSFCYNSMVARVKRAFRVSQGSVETLFRWGGKCLTILQKIYPRNDVPNFITIAQFL